MRSNVHIKLFALTSPQPLSHRRGAKKIILRNLRIIRVKHLPAKLFIVE
jgi:hypothetical protein